MSLRFNKRIKVFPGVRINIGKRSVGVSAGVKGAHVGFNKRGMYTDVGIPGTGVSKFQYISKGHPHTAQATQPASRKNNHLLLKILFFPIWLEFIIAIYLFKIIVEIIVYVFSKLTARPSIADNDNSLSTQVSQQANNQLVTPQEQNLQVCTGELMAKETPEKLEQHYKQMLKYNIQNYNGYVNSGVVKGKCWSIGNEKDRYFAYVCEVCRANAKVGVIPLKAAFPSGHLYPPAGSLCRCDLLPEIEE